jgi:hypothetical protein
MPKHRARYKQIRQRVGGSGSRKKSKDRGSGLEGSRQGAEVGARWGLKETAIRELRKRQNGKKGEGGDSRNKTKN